MPELDIGPAEWVAEVWEQWCGETPWSRTMRRFGELGGKALLWCGRPRCASAIPLCFQLYRPDGTKIPCNSRLKDIKAAVALLEAECG